MKIAQAGLSWSKNQFLMISGGPRPVRLSSWCSSSAGSLLPALGVGFAAAFGVPRWLLSFLKKRREKKFLDHFPDGVDVIVRGIKAGLPLLDSLKIIALDAQEPIKSEFKAIVETQTIGMPIGEACAKLYERMPLPEANFFGIVISIQQKAGGNLSEALGNLSRVLRDRKKMKAKIQAMSMEAKASASIIGALPICVGTLVWLTSPDYIELLWTTDLGRIMMVGMRHVDGHRRLRHEANDQLRLLSDIHAFDADRLDLQHGRQAAHRAAGGGGGGRDRADAGHAGAVARRARQAHEVGRARAREDPPARARTAGARREGKGLAASVAEAIHGSGWSSAST